MKSLACCLILIAASNMTLAQIRTEETRTSTDSTTGETTVTQSVVISKSEDITPRRAMIVINPLKFFLFYNLTFFHRLSAGLAFGLGFQVPTLSGLDGFGINGEVRLHPSGKALRGFYFAPNMSYNSVKTKLAKTDLFSVGGLLGWQWFPGEEFALGLGLGVDYYLGSISDNDGDLKKYDGTVPGLRFDIGYAW